MAIEIKAQDGPQTAFLTSGADIVIYGGSAGGGKSYALLIEPIRHIHNPTFGAVLFRRTTPELLNPGGLWDASCQVYPLLGGVGARHRMQWTFPSGARIRFSHMERESNRFSWQGSEIPMIGFDELCHFTESQFWYMLSRNRSMTGISPYIRATCNPDCDSFVAKLVEWYIDENTGFAIKERSGIIRWFCRNGDELVWGNSKEELIARYGEDVEPKSFTFIPASIHDNKKLIEKDRTYLSNLKALQKLDRERLLNGNWKIRATAGMFFRQEWFERVDAAPAYTEKIRYWERAATKNAGDWTVGTKLGKIKGNVYWVEDVVRFQGSPFEVQQRMCNTATADGHQVTIGLEQDPAAAGVTEIDLLTRMLSGYKLRINRVTKAKEERAKPVSSQCEAGNVKVVRGRWNNDWFGELENFPEGSHDDQVDSFSGAFDMLASQGGPPSVVPMYGRNDIARETMGRGMVL